MLVDALRSLIIILSTTQLHPKGRKNSRLKRLATIARKNFESIGLTDINAILLEFQSLMNKDNQYIYRKNKNNKTIESILNLVNK